MPQSWSSVMPMSSSRSVQAFR